MRQAGNKGLHGVYRQKRKMLLFRFESGSVDIIDRIPSKVVKDVFVLEMMEMDFVPKQTS